MPIRGIRIFFELLLFVLFGVSGGVVYRDYFKTRCIPLLCEKTVL